MRTIKFRAKGSGHWRYGQYVHTGQNPSFPFNRDYTDHILYSDNYGIHFIPITDTDTIGQFTGLYDKNGKEIYEGDLLECEKLPKVFSEVYWNNSMTAFCLAIHTITEGIDYGTTPLSEVMSKYPLRIVGNIYDNPELLKGGKQ